MMRSFVKQLLLALGVAVVMVGIVIAKVGFAAGDVCTFWGGVAATVAGLLPCVINEAMAEQDKKKARRQLESLCGVYLAAGR